MVKCKCSREFRNVQEYRTHRLILMPILPSLYLVDKGLLSKEKYNKLMQEYEDFKIEHNIIVCKR